MLGADYLHLKLPEALIGPSAFPAGSSSPPPGWELKASSVTSWMGWDQHKLWGDKHWQHPPWVSLPEGRVSGELGNGRKGRKGELVVGVGLMTRYRQH